MINFLLRIIYITIIIFVIVGLIRFYEPFYSNDFKRIIDQGEITIGTRIGPTTYYEIKNEKIGFSFDIMKEVAKYLDVKLNVVTFDNSTLALKNLKNRKVDLLADMGILEDIDLTYSHTKSDYLLVYNTNFFDKSDIIDINNNTITIIDSPKIKKSLESFINDKNVTIDIVTDKNIDEIIHLLIENKVKYTILNSDELKFYQGYFSEIKVAYKIDSDIKYSWALPKDSSNQLKSKISVFFTDMLKNNKIKYIKQKNLNANTKYSFVGSKNFIKDLANKFPLYEFYFKSYSKKYNHDWRLLASIGYQESRWDKDAISYTGVRGIMMLTKNTSSDMNIKDRTNPKESIYGGAKYLRAMLDKIPSQVSSKDKIWFAIAAYNIGFGHVMDAINLAKEDNIIVSDWKSIEPYLLRLSKSKYYKKTKYGYARGWETVKYVQNIRQYYDILVFLDSQDYEIKNKAIDNNIPSTL